MFNGFEARQPSANFIKQLESKFNDHGFLNAEKLIFDGFLTVKRELNHKIVPV